MGRVERLRIVTLGVAMAAAAFALLATGAVGNDAPAGGTFWFPPIILIAFFAVAEAAVVHVLLRRQTVSASLSEIPLVLGLFFVSPVVLVLTRLAGSFFALLLWRRQPALKLALRIVAEGVEDAATRALLTRFGCDLAQGYYFCRPVAAAEILEFARWSALEHELGEVSREAVLRTKDGGALGIVADPLHHQQG